jgi:putative transposase
MRKHYSATQKARIVLQVLTEEQTVQQIASQEGVHPNQIYQWKAQVLEGLPSLLEKDRQAERTSRAAQERELNELYAQLGRLTTQLAWLKKKSGLEPDAH